ncbi:MAG: hypothetical protein V5783_06115 [Pontiella sp.]
MRASANLNSTPMNNLRDILPHMTNHAAKDYTPSQWKAALENR